MMTSNSPKFTIVDPVIPLDFFNWYPESRLLTMGFETLHKYTTLDTLDFHITIAGHKWYVPFKYEFNANREPKFGLLWVVDWERATQANFNQPRALPIDEFANIQVWFFPSSYVPANPDYIIPQKEF